MSPAENKAELLTAAALVGKAAAVLRRVRLPDHRSKYGIDDAVKRTASGLRGDAKWLRERAKEL